MDNYRENVRDAFKRKWSITRVCQKYGYEYPDVSASYAMLRREAKKARQ